MAPHRPLLGRRHIELWIRTFSRYYSQSLFSPTVEREQLKPLSICTRRNGPSNRLRTPLGFAHGRHDRRSSLSPRREARGSSSRSDSLHNLPSQVQIPRLVFFYHTFDQSWELVLVLGPVRFDVGQHFQDFVLLFRPVAVAIMWVIIPGA